MTLIDSGTLAEGIKLKARELGFDLVGIAAAGPTQSHARYVEWLARGRHGDMAYLARADAVARRADVRQVLPEARSVVVVGINYFHPSPPFPLGAREGQVARYAWGDDYHTIIADKLKELGAFIETETGGPVAHKICVDTSAVLEREWAMRAGLGWIGKNTLLINPRAGSWFVLGEVLLALDLDADAPPTTDYCGTCTRCIEACPTRCILPDRELDASRCLSYLTIELRGDIPGDLAELMGGWVFGCDVCQQVCPWNRFARPTREPAFAPRHARLDLDELLSLDEASFRERFIRSALTRAKRSGLARNAGALLARSSRRADEPLA